MKNLLLLFWLCKGAIYVNGQVGIGTDEPKSALDIKSTTSGILIPRLTGEQVLAATVGTEQQGMLVYATSTSGVITSTGFWYYNGASWQNIGVGAGSGGSSQTVVYSETSGTEITVSESTEKLILSESIRLSSVSTLTMEGVVNVKSSNQSIVPELRLEIKDSSDKVVFTKTVRKGIITTPTVQLQDDLGIHAIEKDLQAGTYKVSLYASQPSCCNVSGLSYVTGGSDTVSFMKIIY